MKKCRLDVSLYLVTDQKGLSEPLDRIVEEAICGGVSLVQIREKESDSRTFYYHVLALKKVTDAYQIPLIINDRLDIMLAAGADGVHLGQSDIPVGEARRLLGDEKIIGASAHSVSEALQAEREGADYIGAGAIFQTNTKKDTSVMTAETLSAICAAVSIPVVAIGGITAGNINQIKNTGISGAAISSAILHSQNPKLTAEQLRREIHIAR
ncbi:MAG: thiamine phosphate synthase [Dialister sp.]|nr:thiamine phosphate synthase [Dialister sp.]